MNLILNRTEYESDGIFGQLLDENNNIICVTLEHAYDSSNGDGSYAPKLPAGIYTCERGQHQLANMKAPFTTFEIMNVPGHTNILYHVGNYNKDSEGCVLLGQEISSFEGHNVITHSKAAFQKFMELQENIDQFTLTVKDK